jgi:predicted signal transduction protein with EAL and GGDEF domain
VAERILAAFSVPVVVGGRQVTPSASIGVATSDGIMSSNELLMQADVAMYAAKAAGKGRMATFDAAMGNALRIRADLHEALRDAVCRGEIVVHYQPIYDVRTQSLSRVEALVRWQRPEGLLAPIEFLPLAEDTGLIVGIGQEVLRQTCEQMRGWLNEDASRSVSVNVSALQLAETNYAERVLGTLAAADVEPSQFSLEVTETLFLDPTPGLISRLDTLRSFGIRVSIDDFGTGYSSLGRLHTLPIDSIKIDKSFVDLIQEGDDALPIITSIVVMAHALGLDATAEGVETPHQAARLTALGCDYLQGYQFGRPVPAAPEGA